VSLCVDFSSKRSLIECCVISRVIRENWRVLPNNASDYSYFNAFGCINAADRSRYSSICKELFVRKLLYFDLIDLGNRRSKEMILFIEDGRQEPGTVGSHECDYDCASYLGRLRNSWKPDIPPREIQHVRAVEGTWRSEVKACRRPSGWTSLASRMTYMLEKSWTRREWRTRGLFFAKMQSDWCEMY